jgi:hypothetical protein
MAISKAPATTRLTGSSDNTKIGNVGDSIKTTITSAALPTGAATAAKQDTNTAAVNAVNTKLSDGNQQSKIRGDSTGTLIGNVGDALKIFDASGELGSLTTFKADNDVTLTSSYSTLHSVSGSGLLFGATFVVDNDAVDCRIQIDGQTVFEFNGEFLKEVVNKDSDFRASGIFSVSNDGKRLYFTPQTPVRYTTSLNFSARLNGKKVKYQLYTYTVV